MKPKFSLSFLTLTSLVFSTQSAIAQTYTPSNRIPVADSTQIGTQVSGNGSTFNITGGVNKGQTLFHSFTDFSVPTSGTANFVNITNPRDIITRVTGNVFSDINGIVNTNGANFFLINPNGIVFGTNAQLNVGRAFVGSTANSIDLVDAGGQPIKFGTNPNGDALLSVAPNVLFNVSSLTMGGGTGEIKNFGTLQTNNNSGQYIGLIGGNVTLDGGKIIAPGGRVDIGGLNSAGTVAIDSNGLVFSGTGLKRSDILLTNDAAISVRAIGTLDTVNTFFNNAAAPGSSINVSANNLDILNSGVLNSSTLPAAIDAGLETNSGVQTIATGDIKIDATGKVNLNNSNIKNTLRPGAEGSIGDIKIQADALDVKNQSLISSVTAGKGNAGNIKVTAIENISVDNGSTFSSNVSEGGVGKGGNVEINAKNLSVTNGAQLTADTLGKGDAGSIKITATGNIALDGNSNGFRSGIFSNVQPGSEGKGGGVEIITGNLSGTNGAGLGASTFGQGDAGNLKITATGNVSFDGLGNAFNTGAFSTVENGASGKGGGIEITTGNLFATNGAVLNAATFGKGDAGSVKITATGNIYFDSLGNGFPSGAFSTVQPEAEGKGGGIEITTDNLFATNGAVLNAATFGKGDAGSVKITATGNIYFDSLGNGFPSGAFSTIQPGADGKGGIVEISARNLSVTNGAAIVASTFGKGDAGSVKITATENVLFDGFDGFNGSPSGAFSSIQTGAVGNSGGVVINTRNLFVTNGARLFAGTLGRGDAGTVKITATGDVAFDGFNVLPSGAFSTVEEGGVGKGGGVEISAQNLSVTNGAEVAAFTRGKGDAGSVKITATRNILLDGKKDGGNSGVFSTIEQGGVGKGGGIEITADNLFVTNLATVTTSSKGQGDAGNIFLNANKIALNNPKDAVVDVNNGGIISIALGSTGGDIKVVAKDYLLLRNNSLIATDSASTGKDGNGGNITISSPLIIATPGNNDITANASAGNGGRVDITSQGLFGIQSRPNKGQASPFTNDITARSDFGPQGKVSIDTPGTDPGRDSTELPNTTTDASNQISQVCSANNRQNKLTVTGRGGLPPNANDPLTSDVVWQDARATNSQPAVSSAPAPAKFAPPAVGWVFDGKGKVTLIAAGSQAQTGTKVVCPQGVGK